MFCSRSCLIHYNYYGSKKAIFILIVYKKNSLQNLPKNKERIFCYKNITWITFRNKNAFWAAIFLNFCFNFLRSLLLSCKWMKLFGKGFFRFNFSFSLIFSKLPNLKNFLVIALLQWLFFFQFHFFSLSLKLWGKNKMNIPTNIKELEYEI